MAASHRRFRATGLAGSAFAAIVCVALAAPADTDDRPLTVYQWTDGQGIYRYTPDLRRVPRYARDSVVTIEAGEGPPSQDPVYFNPDPNSPVVTVPPPPVGTDSEPYKPSPGDQWTEYDARIRDVETRIAQYEERLKQRISTPGSDSDENSAELSEIARRLPQLKAELERLYRGRTDDGNGP